MKVDLNSIDENEKENEENSDSLELEENPNIS